MKRFFFSLIALAAVTIGCTKSGLVEVPQTFETPISFDPYTGKAPTTKATVMDEDALKADMTTLKGGFHVSAFTRTGEGVNYATPYMDENVWWAAATTSDDTETEDPEDDGTETVAEGDETEGNEAVEGGNTTGDASSTTPKGTWDYEGKAYWPEGALDFVAYGLNAERHMQFSSNKDFTYTVPTFVSDQEDLIVSKPQPGMTNVNGAAINLPFYHLLSKVGFSLQTNDDPDNVTVKIKKIELNGNFFGEGTVDMTLVKDHDPDENHEDLRPYITPVPTSNITSYSLFGTLKTDTQNNTSTVIYYDNETAGSYDCFEISAAEAMEVTPIAATHTLTVTANPTDDEPIYSQSTSTKPNATPLNRYMMIIPCTPGTSSAPATISVIYEISEDIERTAVAQLDEDFTFDAGKGYEFVLKVSTLRVDFSVKVDDYTDDSPEDSFTLTPVIPEEDDNTENGDNTEQGA